MSSEKQKLLFLPDENWSWNEMTLWKFLSEGNFPRDGDDETKSWSNFFTENSADLHLISEGIYKEACFDSCKPCIVYPPINQVFRAFIPLSKIKVVVVGQDPYHNGSAVGLCFSVKPGNKINPSLRSIYTELENEGFEVVKNGDLTHWARQGCAMFNTALTVEKGNAGVHTHVWYTFMEKVIRYISTNTENVAWLLMGKHALELENVIDSSKHKLFITSHPMPLSAYKSFRGNPAFMGSNVFLNINKYLAENRKKPIKW